MMIQKFHKDRRNISLYIDRSAGVFFHYIINKDRSTASGLIHSCAPVFNGKGQRVPCMYLLAGDGYGHAVAVVYIKRLLGVALGIDRDAIGRYAGCTECVGYGFGAHA